MTHIIVRNDESVLSRATPHGPLVWLDLRLTECTEYRYAITFERPDAARKCAAMQGATVHTIGDWNATKRHREIGGSGVRDCDGTRGEHPVRGPQPAALPAQRNRPVRLVASRAAGAGEPRRDAGHPPARLAPYATPEPYRVAAGNAACAPVSQADWRARQSAARLAAYYDEFARARW